MAVTRREIIAFLISLALIAGVYATVTNPTSYSPTNLSAGTTYRACFGQQNEAATPLTATVVCSDEWTTTAAGDTTPTAFTFTDVTGANFDTVYSSNTITVAGIDAAAVITVAGCGYSKNGAAVTEDAGTVVVTDTVRLEMTSSAESVSELSCLLNIGGVTDTWTITTRTDTTALIGPIHEVAKPPTHSIAN